MIVRVNGVVDERILDARRSGFAVVARSRPLLLGQRPENRSGAGSRPTKRLQRWLDWPVVKENLAESILVVSLQERMIFGNHAANPDRRGHFAIAKMVHDLSRRPLSGSFPRIKLFGGDPFECGNHRVITVRILVNQFVPSLCSQHE